MKYPTAKAGFSFIELLIVIAIIGVLSTLVTVSLSNARRAGRDARRLTDINQIQLALKLYFLDTGAYPTYVSPNTSIAAGGTSYLLRVPENPAPRNDNGCPDASYSYRQLQNGSRYALNFCLGSLVDNLEAGSYTATTNGVLTCPEGYVRVVGSAEFNTIDFCAMKYEAKCQTAAGQPLTSAGAYDNLAAPCDGANQVASTAAGVPIANISLGLARSYCRAIGGHLMTKNEWMTIAHDAEMMEANWSENRIVRDFMPRGNFSGDQVMDGFREYAGQLEANDFNYRRTLMLSSGEKIWDMAGNAAEIVDGECKQGSGQGKYYDTPGGLSVGWHDINLYDYEVGAAGPIHPAAAEKRFGNYRGCSEDDNVLIRGGGVNDSEDDIGIYYLDMTKTENGTAPATGFRCVK